MSDKCKTKKELQEKLKAMGVKRVTGFNKAQLEEMIKAEDPAKTHNKAKAKDEFSNLITKSYVRMNKKEPPVRKRDIPKATVLANRLKGLEMTEFLTDAYKKLGKTEPKFKKQTQDTEAFLMNAAELLQRQINDYY